MSNETKGAAPEARCPRCQAVKEPTKAQQQIEGWPCYDPFHEGWADAERQRQEHLGRRIWTAKERVELGNNGVLYRECRWTDAWQRGETGGLHWHAEPAVKAGPPTPELEKQAQAIKDGAHQIGEFLDHLRERGLHLASFGDNDQLYLVHERPEATIAAFFGIDLARIEQERRALLEYVRSR